MSTILPKNDKKILPIIAILSVVVPLLVAILMSFPQSGKLGDLDVSFLPHLNGTLNSATAILLIAGFLAIRSKKIELHRTFMLSAFVLSSIFLISYVIYHFQVPSTIFGDLDHSGDLNESEALAIEGVRSFYLVILLTHIALSTIIVPLVLLSIYFAFSNQIDRHKKIVRFTFPIWVYVAITGVVVYWMISPYYA
ncbi:MAG: putative membrane protein [Flammeovirgaceae bacterium]|jgi:putative membrane protein